MEYPPVKQDLRTKITIQTRAAWNQALSIDIFMIFKDRTPDVLET